MNDKERQIIDLIRQNPYITQQELAERVSISRSAVAGYVSSLMKSGVITGRAYVLNDFNKVLCIGGANVDIKARLYSEFKVHDSNPVKVSESVGGVARNIAENLGSLKMSVSLLTFTGDDSEAAKIRENTEDVDFTIAQVKKGARTGSYTAVLNDTNDLMFALADMEIYDKVTIDDIKRLNNHVMSANLVVLDTNFPKDVLAYLLHKKSDKQRFVMVTVSAKKISRLPDDLSQLDYLIMNRAELAAVLDKMSLSLDWKGMQEKMTKVQEAGVKNIVVTMGQDGACYLSEEGEYGELQALPADIKDVTGAGDAFSAGVIYALNEGSGLKNACECGLHLAKQTLETDQSVVKIRDTDMLQRFITI
ncbi:winged helix-turn-helix transcriptional regulator [Bacillus sp. A301a_S52]|nr:winged helix-turn-helix transcriptional regulator [Bacillus sp. A301a_S52]